MTYSTQKIEGTELNRLYETDIPIHEWYRFVLSYPPHLVRHYLEKFQVGEKNCVLDPFCGTGTTLVECKKLRIPSVGIEANPVAHMAAKAKTNWNIDTRGLIKHAEKIAIKASNKLASHNGEYKTLSDECNKLIIKNSISPLPLHKTLILVETLNESFCEEFDDLERTALAKLLVHSYSNLYFGPEVGVRKVKKDDAPVVDNWLNQIKKMAYDIDSVQETKVTPSHTHLSDSRIIDSYLEPYSIDTVITSPPYPNEKDYTRITRLESVILGFISSKKDLRAHKDNLLRSNTRNIYKNDNDDKWIDKLTDIHELADKIENIRIQLKKTSGFEKLYHRVVRQYFGGMAKHLEQLKPKLRHGAQLAYVVGDQASYFRVHIKTGELLAKIAEEIGYELVNIDLFRTRLSTTTKQQLREEVVLLRWNG